MKQFENDAYAVEADSQPGCRLHLKVDVKSPQLKRLHKQAIKKINKQISIPGFRKGRAPDSTVLSQYSNYVDQEWKELLVQDAFSGALDLCNIYPLRNESVDKPKLESADLELGATILFSYEHYPEVPEVDFTQLTLKDIPVKEIEEEQIEGVFKEIQKAQADFEAIEDRGIEVGDYVDLTIDALDNDPPSSIVKDRRFAVDPDVMAPWMITALSGKKAGETFETKSETDDKMSEKEKEEFRPTPVRIEIHSLKKIIMPELNEELAKKVGATSVEDLREKVKTNLENEALEEQKRLQQEAVEEELLKAYTFDLPTSVVAKEKEHRLAEKIKRLKAKRLTDEEIKAKEGEVAAEVDVESDRGLRLFFLEKQIASQGKVEVTKDELNLEFLRQMSQNPSMQKMDESHTREMISRLNSNLMQRKTREYALEQVMAAAAS